ncbi:putative selenium metabolism protein, YedE family [Clostridium aceticum]|uniref:Putative selenium metabolism protein, YedE family n=1 Tax=Clostridium aceticum TaxID=84022 RepID=A0A0D8IEI3_9CLOT|nr:YedE family putative selenium transporter [Clostridium aceticum]AKL94396.1 putative selenium metabolism protein, YedE family [Clostridium aceticum]KJF28377.1 membrane protein [Clostridium aceticum]
MQEGKSKIIVSGGLVGLLAALLVKFGNPVNMGICVACFFRDIAGGLGLHRAAAVQYLRPEISGFILGSFGMAKIKGEFKSRGGSSPLLRFVLGFFLMIGALVFLGCPLRMILRLANGDLNALLGLFGYVAGIWIGIQFLKQGFTLGKNTKQTAISGYTLPGFAIAILIFLLAAPAFIFFSESGPGSMTAPIVLALAAGLVVGAVLQRTRLCTAGGIRDILLIKDYHYLWGLIGIFVFALLGNLLFNFDTFKIGFQDQPIAHSDHLWNFLGMTLAGIAAVLLGGCPLRQSILAGEGDTDAAITIFGLMAGAAFAHNFSLAASPQGVGLNGKVAVIIGLFVVLAIGYGVVKSVTHHRETLNTKGGIETNV